MIPLDQIELTLVVLALFGFIFGIVIGIIAIGTRNR